MNISFWAFESIEVNFDKFLSFIELKVEMNNNNLARFNKVFSSFSIIFLISKKLLKLELSIVFSFSLFLI